MSELVWWLIFGFFWILMIILGLILFTENKPRRDHNHPYRD